ncbi:MAG TPA: hypothetical protein DCZ19_09260 [Porphyromonadaceae bacterium]|nr:MAG: hypothetical protein A2W87_02870 [Bacteroidetes bacterium GWC2_46_850]OFX75693.1 MAG: hypothetical protein A2071_08970 [Bacteroidetes bacterium GWC1_47_7]HBB01239.1 hypothetical protein [Porphyromonadaceae bacterium]
MINQILIYTRPWEVRFGIMLATEFSRQYPDKPIKFVTFFSLCKKMIQSDGRFEVIYMPKLLNEVTGNEINEKDIAELDNLLYCKSGANLNMMLNSERFLPKDSISKDIFRNKHLIVLDKLVIKGTLSVSSMYDHFVYWLAGALATAKNGYHFAFCASGLPPNRTTIFKTPWETWTVSRSIEETNHILDETIQKLNLPVEQRVSYMKKDEMPSFRRRFNQRYKEFKCSVEDWNSNSYFVTKNPYLRILRRFFMPLLLYNSDYKHYTVSDLNDIDLKNYKYLFVPLHYEPEAVINMFSPWLRDQIEMCRLISQALPTNVKLIVKDHPLMSGIRKKEYYKKIQEIPNVLLVPSRIQSNNLLGICIGVICLAGTAANEAALLGKPSICLGKPPFRKNVQYADFAEDFQISDLYSVIKKWEDEDEYKLDLHSWNTWVNSQIDIPLVPVMNGVVKEINVEYDDLKKFTQFINDSLSKNE